MRLKLPVGRMQASLAAAINAEQEWKEVPNAGG